MPDSNFLPEGTELIGEYRIERVLGRGGFGVTYEATDLGLMSRRAVKEYFPFDFARRDDNYELHPLSEVHENLFVWGRESFVREARTLDRFDHPGIVRVMRIFEALNTAYIVLRYEEGPNLKTWLQDLGRRPTQSELDHLASKLLDALDVLHAENYIHRDIAPDNIIVRPDGDPVLIDFGAARQILANRSEAVTGVVTGVIKAGYSPPEQYASNARLQGPWTDIYATAATLYRAAAGDNPTSATERQVDDILPPATETIIGDYRPSFLAAIDRALSLSLKDRPQSVSEFRKDLLGDDTTPTQSVPGRPAEAAATAPMDVTQGVEIADRRRGGGRSLRAGLAMLVVTLAVFVGVVYLFVWHEDRSRPTRTSPQPAGEQHARKAPPEEAEKKRREDERRRALERKQADDKAWADAKAKGTLEAFRAYLNAFPDGAHAEDARRELARLEKTTACKGVSVSLGDGSQKCIKPGKGERFRDCPTCPVMTVLPAGQFRMGSPLSEPGRRNSEGPLTSISIARGFAIGLREVTRAEFGAFVRATKRAMGESCNVYEKGSFADSEGRSYKTPGFAQTGDHPAVCVSWHDAAAYASWLTTKTGKTYRLPSEAEWEFAARAQTKTAYFFGPRSGNACSYANGADKTGKTAYPEWKSMACEDGFAQTAPVASFAANPFGLHDMLGNVWEWVQDCWIPTHDGRPQTGEPRRGGDCQKRVLRGGSWFSVADNLRSAVRENDKPDAAFTFAGFRVARDL